MAKSSVSLRAGSASLPATTLYVHNNASVSKRKQPAASAQRGAAPAIRFAHPAEAEIARLLDFYDVPWQYEPKTFSLVTDEQGLPVRSITPDFYLPEQDLYIEMTTMRQSLVTRKNRKFRVLRELYPDLNVKLLYRKDVEHILDRYSDSLEADGSELPLRQVIREEQIHRRSAEMADALIDQSAGPYHLLALGVSAQCTQRLLAERLKTAGHEVAGGLLSVDTYRPGSRNCSVQLASGGDLVTTSGDVVVVADIIGTGLTALAAIKWLRSRGVERVRLVSLLDRPSSRLVDVPLDLAGFTVTSCWHVGAGLGRNPRYRDLPDIHAISATPAA